MVRSQSFWALLMAVLFAVTSLAASEADARGNSKKKKRAKSDNSTETTGGGVTKKAIAELMGAFKFGMSREQVSGIVTKQITSRYAELVKATSDVYRQDQLRRERDKEIQELKSSVVEFNGKKSGWDVSMVDEQFVHGTGESMLVYWETAQGRNQRRFFFFHDGKLFRMFVSLDTSTLDNSQRNFEFFRELMESRFGAGDTTHRGLEWYSGNLHVEAMDKLAFYNAFCIVITDFKQFAKLLALREEKAPTKKKHSTIIEAVTSDGEDDTPSLDEGANTIDRILKKK